MLRANRGWGCHGCESKHLGRPLREARAGLVLDMQTGRPWGWGRLETGLRDVQGAG